MFRVARYTQISSFHSAKKKLYCCTFLSSKPYQSVQLSLFHFWPSLDAAVRLFTFREEFRTFSFICTCVDRLIYGWKSTCISSSSRIKAVVVRKCRHRILFKALSWESGALCGLNIELAEKWVTDFGGRPPHIVKWSIYIHHHLQRCLLKSEPSFYPAIPNLQFFCVFFFGLATFRINQWICHSNPRWMMGIAPPNNEFCWLWQRLRNSVVVPAGLQVGTGEEGGSLPIVCIHPLNYLSDLRYRNREKKPPRKMIIIKWANNWIRKREGQFKGLVPYLTYFDRIIYCC